MPSACTISRARKSIPGTWSALRATLREVLAIRCRILGDDHPDTAYTLNNLAFVLLEKGDWASATPFAAKALEICRKSFGERHHMTGMTTGNVARASEARGDYHAADAGYDQALAILRESDGPDSLCRGPHPRLQGATSVRPGAVRSRGGAVEPVAALRQHIDPRSTYVASSLIGIGESRIFQHDASGAVPLLRQALEIRMSHYAPTHPAVIAAKVRLGEALWLAGSSDQAESILEDALHSSQTAPYALFNWQQAEVESALGACLKSRGRATEGARLLAKSRAALASDPRPVFRIPADRRFPSQSTLRAAD